MNREPSKNGKIKEVLIEEIIEKFQRGEKVQYENANIKGDLSLVEFNLPRNEKGRIDVKSEISIDRSKIEGKIDFSEATFYNSINISSVIVNGDAQFARTEFNKEVSLIGVQFDGQASFAGTHFMRRAIFYRTRFNKSVSFINSIFELQARFDECEFSLDASFESTIFEFAYLNGAKFYANADFQRAIFKRSVEIKKVLFIRKASFVGARFEEDANFNETEFHSDANFNGAAFEGIVDFSRSQFDGSAVFSNDTYFNKELKLDEITVYRMRLEAKFNEALHGQLSLKNSDVGSMIVPWENIKNHLAYDGSAYLSLIKNYNNLESFDDADNCLYQYRLGKRKTLPLTRKIVDYIICGFLGYGVRPQYPIFLSFGIIIIASIIYWLGHQASLNALELSSTIFFTQTEMGSLTGLCRTVGLIESALGVILMACFVISLTKWTLR